MPKVTVSEKQAVRFCNGGELSLDRIKNNFVDNTVYRVYSADKFLGLGTANTTENILKIVCLVDRQV